MIIEFESNYVLFLGNSGNGKSVLSSFFSQKPNCYCYSDDLLCYNYISKKLYPMSKYIYLRSSSLSLQLNIKNLVFDPFLERYKILANNTNFKFDKELNHIFILNRVDKSRPRNDECLSPVENIIKHMYCPYTLKSNVQAAISLSLYNTSVLTYDNLNELYMFLKKTFNFT